MAFHLGINKSSVCLEINVPSGITMEKVITTATELFIRLSCWLLIIKRSISGLTNIAAATTTLQHTRCTQTDNYFTTTAYYCQGQRQPEDSQGAVYKIKCCTCQATYITENGRNLSSRLTEHKQATRNGDVKSHCWTPYTDETSNQLGLCDMYYVFYKLLSKVVY